MLGTLFKELRNMHLYDGVDANVLVLIALKTCKGLPSSLHMFLAYSSASSGSIEQLEYHRVPERSTALLDADRNTAGEVVDLSGNKPIDVSVYFGAQRRFGTSAISTSRKQIFRYSRGQKHAAKRACVESRYVSAWPSSVASILKDENICVNIFSNGAHGPVTGSNSALNEGALQ